MDPKWLGEFLFGYVFNYKLLEYENAEGEKLFFFNKNKSEVKQNRIRFEFFPVGNRDIRLGRFDLCYCFDFSFPELGKRSDIKTFWTSCKNLASCKKKFLSKYSSQKVSIARKYLKCSQESKKILSDFWKSEPLEVRQECLKSCLNPFFSSSFEEFENELVGIFLVEFQDLWPENSKYSFLLLDRLRKKS